MRYSSQSCPGDVELITGLAPSLQRWPWEAVHDDLDDEVRLAQLDLPPGLIELSMGAKGAARPSVPSQEASIHLNSLQNPEIPKFGNAFVPEPEVEAAA